MNRELAYRCQMLLDKDLNSRTFAVTALLKTGWSQEVIDNDIDEALAWARSQRLTAKQEKYRRSRADKKAILKGNDAVEAMFASVGVAPEKITPRN